MIYFIEKFLRLLFILKITDNILTIIQFYVSDSLAFMSIPADMLYSNSTNFRLHAFNSEKKPKIPQINEFDRFFLGQYGHRKERIFHAVEFLGAHHEKREEQDQAEGTD